MFYSIAKAIVWFFMHLIFRVRAVGVENIPKTGGVVLAVNHRSNWDVVMAGITCPRQLTFMAKAELFKNKIFAALISSLGAFPIKRGSGDVGAYRAAMSILRGERVMLMFPEGHRTKKGASPARAKTGVAMFAIKAEVPVVPVYISGEYRWLGKVTVTYGAPITFEEHYGKKQSSEELQVIADSILNKIRGLKEQ